MKRKLLLFSLCLAVCLGAAALTGFPRAAGGFVSGPTSGECGDACNWWFSEALGLLVIEGEGPMYDYEFDAHPWAIYHYRIKSLELRGDITHIGNNAFTNLVYVKSVNIPDTVVSIGDYAFCQCQSLNDVINSSSLQSIGRNAFQTTNLKGIWLPDGLKEIGYKAFSYTPLRRISIPDSVETLGGWAFHLCSLLEEVELPSGLKALPNGAFYGCTGIKSLRIPQSVRSIGNCAFAKVQLLLDFTGDMPAFDRTCFDSDSTIAAIYPGGNETWTVGPDLTFGASKILWLPDDSSGDTITLTLKQGGDSGPGPTESDNDNARSWDWVLHPLQTSYCLVDGDGVYTRVEYQERLTTVVSFDFSTRRADIQKYNSYLLVERYDSDFCFLDSRELMSELPLWGGFYSGEAYNFLVYGQKNSAEDSSAEVLRIVKYSKDWERLGSRSLYGINTVTPFMGGTVSMAELGGRLYIHTCHEIYADSSGVNHQTNMSFALDIDTMEVVHSMYTVPYSDPSRWDYVSHSFNQFVIADGGRVVKLDHGDAHPRALTIWQGTGAPSKGLRLDLMSFGGSSGDNYTGCVVGGFEASDTHYIAAGISVDQTSFETSRQYNVFLSIVEKLENGMSLVDGTRYVTNYQYGTYDFPSTPALVKLSGDSLLLLWTQWTETTWYDELHYLYLDGAGNRVSPEYVVPGRLSDCQPVVQDGKVVWYVTKNSIPEFYSLEDGVLTVRSPNCITRAKRGGGTVTAEVSTNMPAQLVCAQYDESGRFLGLAVEPLESGGAHTVAFQERETSGGAVKLFMLSEQVRPLTSQVDLE